MLATALPHHLSEFGVSNRSGVGRIRPLIGLLLSVALLGACRVDNIVTLNVKPNGSGTLAVVTTVDAEVVANYPNIGSDLSFDDAKAAGWKVSEVASTQDGGLQVRVSHHFNNPQEATTLLNQLSGEYGPFKDMSLSRDGKDTDSTFTLGGNLEVNGGMNAFADGKLLSIIGGAPYKQALADSNQDIGQAVSITFLARMPGKVVSTSGTPDGIDAITWNVAFDGSSQNVAAVTENTAVASTIARIFSPVLFWLLIAWLVNMAGFSGFVFFTRFRRSKRTPTV